MFSHLRLVPTCFRPLPRPATIGSTLPFQRNLVSSAPRRSDLGPEPAAVEREQPGQHDRYDDQDVLPIQDEGGSGLPTSYKAFMEKIGYQFEHAKPNNWLGGGVPFPMNPTFKPPPPISDQQRQYMWDVYSQERNPRAIRKLSKALNVSIKRVEAIVKLKAIEEVWKKGKQLQTGFQVGMERLLGAVTHTKVSELRAAYERSKPLPENQTDVHQADMLEQEENRDDIRLQYERLYWESIPEGVLEPTMPSILQHARKRAEHKALSTKLKANASLRPRLTHASYIKRPQGRILTFADQSHPATQFIDVGAQFIDVGEQLQRLAVSRHRAQVRRKKSELKTSP